LLKSPQLGSAGPAYRNFRDSELNPMNYQEWMNGYGLPFHDVPGVDTVDDLRDPECARRMGAAMEERCARGDVPGNIGATGLVTNAYLLTGADRFRDWVLEYADAWLDRIDANDGIIPDSVGPSGEIGECIDGKWWGGYYGWTWPHGFHDFAGPLTIGARNARLLGDDPGRLDLLRSQFDVLDDREIGDDDRRYRPQKHGDPEGMPDGGAGDDVLRAADGTVHTEGGWSHYAPGGETAARTHLWHASMEPADRERVSRLGEHDPTEPIEPAWGKWVGGHQRAWLSYLDGDRPSYPESILSTNLAQVNERLRTLREDDPETAVKEAEEAYLQLRNPVVTEGLVHCTLGGPQLIYYGGLQRGRVRHFDADRRRPGLPEDVAVLVTDLKPDRTVVEVVNVGDTERSLVVQAGTFAQHRFGRVTYDTSGGRRGVANIDGDAFALDLDVGAATRIEAETDRFVGDPTYAAPWDR
jgi:hypothetical protein